MSGRTLICHISELVEGEPKRIEVPGVEPLAVVRIDQMFYALSDECSHGAASLGDGWIENGNIICPMHNGGFSLVTGEAKIMPCMDPVRRYDIIVEGDSLFIDG